MIEYVVDAGGLVAALGAAIGLGGIARGWYRRTLGRRRDRYARLSRLGPGAQLAFFEAVLGEAPAIQRSSEQEVDEYDVGLGKSVSRKRKRSESIFDDRDFYVQALADHDGTVLAFSVTTRSSDFRPVFSFPGQRSFDRGPWWRRLRGRHRPTFSVELGRTRINDVFGEEMWRPRMRASLGARIWSYTEIYYLGNPGYYQHFGFTASSVAHAPVGDLQAIADGTNGRWVEARDSSPVDGELLLAFRRATVVTTYTVMAPHFNIERYEPSFGPHGDEVRVLS